MATYYYLLKDYSSGGKTYGQIIVDNTGTNPNQVVQNPRYQYLGSSTDQVKTNIVSAMNKLGVTHLESQTGSVQGPPSALDLTAAGLAFLGPGIADGVAGLRTALAGGDAAATSAAASAAASAASAATKLAAGAAAGDALLAVWRAITTPKTWLRILYFIGGAVAIFFGLKELTGADIPTVKLAK